MEINTTFILGVLTVLGPVIIALFQIKKWKSEAKKEDSEAAARLIDAALKIGSQELEILRAVNTDLVQRSKDLQVDIKTNECKTEELEHQIDELRKINLEKDQKIILLERENSKLKGINNEQS